MCPACFAAAAAIAACATSGLGLMAVLVGRRRLRTGAHHPPRPGVESQGAQTEAEAQP
jgi:hypothetical protein